MNHLNFFYPLSLSISICIYNCLIGLLEDFHLNYETIGFVIDESPIRVAQKKRCRPIMAGFPNKERNN